MNLRRVLFVALAALALSNHVLFAQENPELPPGQIAFIGADLNAYTVRVGSESPMQLTEDARTSGRSPRFYQWPTWSTDGRLALFASVFDREDFIGTEVLISGDGQLPATSAHLFDLDVFTYAYWSPQNCLDDAVCRDLAVLLTRPSAGGFVVELVRDLEADDQAVLTDNGSPFYFSWSPDGTRMLWHRNNTDLDIYDTVEGEISSNLDASAGAFGAPSWSPIDDRLLIAGLDLQNEREQLMIGSVDETVTPLVTGLQGPTAFLWSPDGQRIAYTDNRAELVVVDASTGEEIRRSFQTGVVAFFWSPDSQKIAFITLSIDDPDQFSAKADIGARLASMQQPPVGLAWTVLDLAAETENTFSSFVPTNEQVYLLTFFDQFAQSHRVWSPDSRHLVYAERVNGQEVISVLNTAQLFATPLKVADGSIGIWSFQ
ncbi:MAG: PD40 domain-containing protein [Chloroflexi bacterium]|nr:PD40 domain-containing protein [Chloroflexota bacterium]